MKKNTDELLREGINKIGLLLSEEKISLLMRYLDLLEKWNQAFNLTSIKTREEMVFKHLLDSLSCLPVLEQEKIITLADVGSGAGLPGIPIAIAAPQWKIILIDSNSKKTGFLQQARTELALENVEIVNQRAEHVSIKVDAVISRAFASLTEMVQRCAGLCSAQTILWAMKGKPPEEEINRLLETTKNYRVSASHSLTVPGLVGQRCLLRLESC